MRIVMTDHRLRNGTPAYSNFAASLHWILVLLLAVQIWLGFSFNAMDSGDTRAAWFAWHRTLGFAILALTLLRLVMRVGNPPPPFASDVPRWQQMIAKTVHWLFYTLLIALPLTGWVYVSSGSTAAETGKTTLIGGVPWPILPSIPRDWHGPSGDVHQWLVWITIALIILHTAAALKHQFLDKSSVANRMPPFGRGR